MDFIETVTLLAEKEKEEAINEFRQYLANLWKNDIHLTRESDENPLFEKYPISRRITEEYELITIRLKMLRDIIAGHLENMRGEFENRFPILYQHEMKIEEEVEEVKECLMEIILPFSLAMLDANFGDDGIFYQKAIMARFHRDIHLNEIMDRLKRLHKYFGHTFFEKYNILTLDSHSFINLEYYSQVNYFQETCQNVVNIVRQVTGSVYEYSKLLDNLWQLLDNISLDDSLDENIVIDGIYYEDDDMYGDFMFDIQDSVDLENDLDLAMFGDDDDDGVLL